MASAVCHEVRSFIDFYSACACSCKGFRAPQVKLGLRGSCAHVNLAESPTASLSSWRCSFQHTKPWSNSTQMSSKSGIACADRHSLRRTQTDFGHAHAPRQSTYHWVVPSQFEYSHAYRIHRQRIKNMRPAIDSAPPEDFTNFQYNAKRAMQQAERLFDIERVRTPCLFWLRHASPPRTLRHPAQSAAPD